MRIKPNLVTALRTKNAWSQDELAVIAGLNLRTIQRIEKEASASPQSKKALASAFGIDIAELDYTEESSMKTFEYKTVEMPFGQGGIFSGKTKTPELDKILNEEGAHGWRLHQVIVSASSNFGQSDKVIAILEREKPGAG